MNSSGVFSQSPGASGGSNATGTAQTSSGDQATAGATGSDPAQGSPQTTGTTQSSSGGNGQAVGGGPIVGVASLSKNETIREYNKKKHYNEWQFIYDPTLDRGGLITTPYQTPLQTANLNGTPNGQQPNSNGSAFGSGSSSGFGSSSGSGSSSGFGGNPGQSGFGNGGLGPQQPPANVPQPPQQQQQ